MATITKGAHTVTHNGNIKHGLKKLPNHEDTPSNPRKPRRFTLS